MIRMWMAVSLLCATLFSAPPARADAAQVDGAALLRIELATRQRILAQRIAKTTCYSISGVAAGEMSTQAWLAADEFETNIAALLGGSGTLGLKPETDRALVKALRVMDDTWRTFGAAARQLVSGDRHSVPIAQIIYKNPVMLSQIDDVVFATSAVYAPQMTARKDRLETVKLAAGQVMLLEKMAMQYCYVALDIRAQDMRGGLSRNIAMFDKVLTALENGDFELSVIDPPSLKFLIKVSDIRTAWDQMRPLLVQVVEGETPAFSDLENLAVQAAALAGASGELVTLYMTAD